MSKLNARTLTFSLIIIAAKLPVGLAQTSVAAGAPTFDVASIHLSPSSFDGHHHIYNDVHASQFRTGNLSLRDLIQYAYNLPKDRILGGPEWLDSGMYEIDAKSGPEVDARLKTMSSEDAAQQKRLMVQALLADRFLLTVHSLRSGSGQRWTEIPAIDAQRHHH